MDPIELIFGGIELLFGIAEGTAWMAKGFDRSSNEPGYKSGVVVRLIVLGILAIFACGILYTLANPSAVFNWLLQDVRLF